MRKKLKALTVKGKKLTEEEMKIVIDQSKERARISAADLKRELKLDVDHEYIYQIWTRSSRLTVEQLQAVIDNKPPKTRSKKELAVEFGVSTTTIQNIWNDIQEKGIKPENHFKTKLTGYEQDAVDELDRENIPHIQIAKMIGATLETITNYIEKPVEKINKRDFKYLASSS